MDDIRNDSILDADTVTASKKTMPLRTGIHLSIEGWAMTELVSAIGARTVKRLGEAGSRHVGLDDVQIPSRVLRNRELYLDAN